MSQQPLIAVRIKDGLFVGNATAAQDDEFLFLNKVQSVVNCCSAEVSNLFAQANVQYLSFPWKDLPNTVLFDSHDRNVEQIVQFIDKGLKDGECVLVHSYFGVSRCCAVVAAFLMVKYGWTVDNTLTFMSVAHPDMQIKPYFLRQLRAFAKRQPEAEDVFHPYIDTTEFALDNDQWMLRNTYLNSLTSDVLSRSEIVSVMKRYQLGPEFVPYSTTPKYVNRRRLTFVDTKQGSTVASTVTLPIQQGRTPATSTANTAATHHSILVDTEYIPQRHSLLSSVNIDPKGRQSFHLLSPVTQTAPVVQEPTENPSYYSPRAEYAGSTLGTSVLNPHLKVAQSSSRPASAPPATAVRALSGSTVHSPFVLKATAGARKGSPMPDARRSSMSQRDNASSPNTFVQQQTHLAHQPATSTVQRIQQPRANSPMSMRNSAVHSPSGSAGPSMVQTNSDLLPKKTYTTIHSASPGVQVRASSPTQRKTAQPSPHSVHVDPQMTLGMGLRGLHGYTSDSTTYRPSTPTGGNTMPSSVHRPVQSSNSTVRHSTPTGPSQPFSSSNTLRAARPTMTSLRKNVRPT